ncbi:ABC transporter permease [Hymenobacter siberiensis]|jgi:putative ABC transport system permease protein|uniref:ABC transporter permease n=1 Tax=Hymenobacter siberiensis TaxID=2848396 RepID=UPI001C1E1022|nr:FtsX-like permease family protein [Hymenobacter siberiensis]MBU6120634.1 FtsX-like permease family protein [Hymenobacter siberiensis]
MLHIALQFIRYDKAKSIGTLLGIIISLFLVGQQSGVFVFLTNAMSSLVDNTATDLWVVDNRTTNVNALAKLDIRLLREVGSLPGVRRAYALVVAGGAASFPNGTSAGVQIIGSEAPLFRAGPKELVQGAFADLIPDGAMSFDQFDRKTLGGSSVGSVFEIGGKRVYLATMSKGLRGFGAVYLFTTLERARYLGNVPTTQLSAVLVDVQPGADPIVVRDRINRSLYGVRAWRPRDFALATKKTVLGTSGIAVSFGSLIAFAVISGFFIIGLTLYSAAIDRLKDYGTLKAIGASNGYVARLILLQALIFAVVGFGLGYALIEGFRFGIGKSGVLFSYSWVLRGAFLGITLLISMGGAVFAIRRISGVEPASVFRG